MADLVLAEAVLEMLGKFDPSNATAFLDNLTNLAPKAIESLDGVNRKISDTVSLSGEAKDQIDNLLSGVKKLGSEGIEYLSNLATNVNLLNPALVSTTGQVGLLVGALTGIVPAAEGFVTIGKAAKESGVDLDTMFKSLEKIPGIGRMVKPLGSVLEIGEPAKQFENSMIRMYAEAGTLGELLGEVGNNLEGMTMKALRFSQQTSELGNASGLSSKQIAEYSQQLLKIPGALDSIVMVEPGTEYLSYLDASLKLATGTGQSFNEVAEQTSFMFQELGVSGRPVLENLAAISAASGNLRMQLSDVRDFSRSAASGFKYLGDNTQGALTVLDRFGGALQKTGLGNQAVLETTKGMIDNINRMSVAQNAFLSSQTGGPGGLQGAFQVDLLKSQGKIDEVYKMVEQSLRQQFGGRIVTLQEGAQDSRLAGQLMKQVAILTEGPTKIAGSKEEAYRILEAMQKGIGPGTKQDTEAAFRNALEIGDKIQERQYNTLVQIENEMQKAGNLAAISAYNLSRIALGTGGDINAQNIARMREEASQFAAIFQEKTSPDEIKDSNLELSKYLNESFSNLSQTVSGAMGYLGGLGANILNEGGKTAAEMMPTIGISRPTEGGGSRLAPPRMPMEEMERGALGQEKAQPISVHVENVTTCDECKKEIARQVARKEGSRMISDYDSNRSTFTHTGVMHFGF